LAIVLLGPLISGIRGTVAGTIFSANKSGPFARGWNKGPNPNSNLQSQQRRTTAAFSEYWRNLSQANRDAWDVWAALPAQEKTNSLGQPYYASGFNWYCAINIRLTNVGRATRATPPVIARPAAPTLSAMNTYHTGHALPSNVVYPAGTFSGYDLILFIAAANSHGVISKYNAWRLILQSQAPGSTFTNYQTELEAAFGVIATTQRLFCRLHRQTTDGVRSAASTTWDDPL